MSKYELHCGDCLEVMPALPDASIDAIICDPPYGTTACAWDSVIPFDAMWAQLKRLIKPRAAIALFGSQPFTSALVMSNAEWFKYEWVWRKTIGSGFINSKNRPIATHENVLIFSDGTIANCSDNLMAYYPQGLIRQEHRKKRLKPMTAKANGFLGTRPSHVSEYDVEFVNYPKSLLTFANPNNDNAHPTQKPVPLMEYLIRTYTNEGETVLDFTMGSGTTGVACMSTGRKFIGIEQGADYFEIAQERIADAARIARKEFKPMTGGMDMAELPLFAGA